MTKRGWVSISTIVMMAVGATALVAAQKGGGGGKPTNRVAATVDITCPADVAGCGILGDAYGTYGPSDLSGGAPGASLNGNKEMNLVIGVLDGIARSITLDFRTQRPEDLASQPSDCSSLDGNCLWDWNDDVRTFESGFEIQNNTLDQLGETELSNGLLSVPVGEWTLTRFNMSITSAGDDRLWRFNFNPNIPPTGHADLAKVTRTDACTWVFSALDGKRAALSVIYKPPKGKSYVHHEGRFEMPFEMTFHVPSLCP